MKKLLSACLITAGLMTGFTAAAQEKQRVSPLVKTEQKLKNGAKVSITYSQPSVKGRSIGKDLEPKDGMIWRTGANEATVLETDKDVSIAGNKLPAGKYSLFTIFNGNDVSVIVNKIWDQSGVSKYSQAEDMFRIKTTSTESNFSEKLTFNITEDGKVVLNWGPKEVIFIIE